MRRRATREHKELNNFLSKFKLLVENFEQLLSTAKDLMLTPKMFTLMNIFTFRNFDNLQTL